MRVVVCVCASECPRAAVCVCWWVYTFSDIRRCDGRSPHRFWESKSDLTGVVVWESMEGKPYHCPSNTRPAHVATFPVPSSVHTSVVSPRGRRLLHGDDHPADLAPHTVRVRVLGHRAQVEDPLCVRRTVVVRENLGRNSDGGRNVEMCFNAMDASGTEYEKDIEDRFAKQTQCPCLKACATKCNTKPCIHTYIHTHTCTKHP